MKSELRQRYTELAMRTRILKTLTAAPGTLAGLDKTFELALDDSPEQVAQRAQDATEYSKLLSRTRNHEQEAIEELCELRMEQVDLYVRAMSGFATTMFENIVLKDNEQFVIEHSYRNPVRVRYIGQDGGARTVKAVKARKQTYVDVRELTSDEVTYAMRDLQQGPDVAAAAQATVDIAWDLANKEDVEAFNLMQGGTINGLNYGTGVYGNFITTGAKLSQTFVAHPRIQMANLPVTNDLVLTAGSDTFRPLLQKANGTGAGQSNLFRLDVIRTIMWYCTSFGQIFGVQLRPTGAIHVPSADAAGLTAEIVPTGTFYNKIAEGILENFTQFDYMGVRWTVVPDVTLPPGACYPVLNRPVGKKLTKPSFDQEFVESNPRKNYETRSASRVLALATFEPDRVNALRVTYSSAYAALTANE